MTPDQIAALALLRDALQGTVHSIRATRDDHGAARQALCLQRNASGDRTAAALRSQGFDLDLLRAIPLGGDLTANVFAVSFAGVSL